MKTGSKLLVFTILLCLLGIGTKAQKFETDTIFKKKIRFEKTVASVYFINRGKIIETTTPLKIGEFDTITVSVSWKKRHVEKILFEHIPYTPTEKELKRGKYHFKITPSRTTTYKYIHYFKNGEQFEATRKLIILDKNGKEIEELNK